MAERALRLDWDYADLTRDVALSSARRRQIASKLSSALGRSRFERNIAVRQVLASAPDVALALDLGLGSAYDLSAHDLVHDLAHNIAPTVDRASLCQTVLRRSSGLQEAFGPSLEESWHALNLRGNTGRIGDAQLTSPAGFSFALSGSKVQFADPEGRAPEALAGYDYDLCFPMTAIPLGRLRRDLPLWREDRRYRPLGVLPFLMPDLAEVFRKHSRRLLEYFPIGEIYALQPDFDLWHKPFADWLTEDWQRTTHRSLLWEIGKGTVMAAQGVHKREEVRRIGKPFTGFGDETDQS